MRKNVKYIVASLLLTAFPVFTFQIATSHPRVNDTNGNYATAPSHPKEKKLLNMVNSVRAKGCKCGGRYYAPAKPLKWSNTLEKVAQKHSKYMDQRNRLSHTGRRGSNPGDRLHEVGYKWQTYGENIAAGYPTEEAVVQGWLKSVGHCRNLMNPKFREMGIATSGAFWTQVFAAPF